jgi:hypothetical protein
VDNPIYNIKLYQESRLDRLEIWTEAVYQNWLSIVSPQDGWMTEDTANGGKIETSLSCNVTGLKA